MTEQEIYQSKYTGDEIEALLDKVHNLSGLNPKLWVFWSDAEVNTEITATHVASDNFPTAETYTFTADSSLKKLLDINSFGDWIVSSQNSKQAFVSVPCVGNYFAKL